MSYCTTCQSHRCTCNTNCDSVPYCPPNTYGCSTGCPIKLDFSCIIYHKNNNTITNLTNLELANGSTLELIIDTIDTYIGQLKAGDWTFPYLVTSEGYTINTLQQFAMAVDSELSILNRFKGNVNADPVTLDDGDYFFRVDLDQLRIRLNGVTRQITII